MRTHPLFLILAAAATAVGQPPPPPVISPAGIANAASLNRMAGNALAPGSLATIFGENLAPDAALAQAVPWPSSLAGVSVTFAGMPAAVLYVSPRQINASPPTAWAQAPRSS